MTTMMKKEGFCAPANETTFATTGTCLTLPYVRFVAQMYNERHPNNKITVDSNKTTLLRQLRKAIGAHETEWSRLGFLPNPVAKKLDSFFRPLMPDKWKRNEYEWLETSNIESVMKQYEHRYKTFSFLGVHPIDFAAQRPLTKSCIAPPICQFSAKRAIIDKKTRVATVFNLDRHDQSGSHWVALFVGLDPKRSMYGAYYYDSVGRAPPKEVRKLMKDIYNEMTYTRVKRPFELLWNRARRQYKNTECGVFVMHFVIKCLEGNQDFETITKSIGKDDEVHMLRKVFYRPSKLEEGDRELRSISSR
jgi:hypothetical protein